MKGGGEAGIARHEGLGLKMLEGILWHPAILRIAYQTLHEHRKVCSNEIPLIEFGFALFDPQALQPFLFHHFLCGLFKAHHQIPGLEHLLV